MARSTGEIEFLICYGIDSKGINPPRSPHLSKCLSYFTISDNAAMEMFIFNCVFCGL